MLDLESVSCLLVLNSVTCTPQWIRQPEPRDMHDVCPDRRGEQARTTGRQALAAIPSLSHKRGGVYALKCTHLRVEHTPSGAKPCYLGDAFDTLRNCRCV
jgi:hypothetical protein